MLFKYHSRWVNFPKCCKPTELAVWLLDATAYSTCRASLRKVKTDVWDFFIIMQMITIQRAVALVVAASIVSYHIQHGFSFNIGCS